MCYLSEQFQVSNFIGQNIHSLLQYKYRKRTVSEIWREKERVRERREKEKYTMVKECK